MKLLLTKCLRICAFVGVILVCLNFFLHHKLRPSKEVEIGNELIRNIESDQLLNIWRNSNREYLTTRWILENGKIQMIYIFAEKTPVSDEILEHFRKALPMNASIKFAIKSNTNPIHDDDELFEYKIWLSIEN